MKISFKNDYSEGAHPAILEALLQTKRQQQPDYGLVELLWTNLQILPLMSFAWNSFLSRG